MKSTKRKIAINVVSSGLQVGIVGIVYFFLYKYLLSELKIELLGVWSVVLATSSLANIANFGVSTSVIRYVAIYKSNNEPEKLIRLIFTSAIFLAVVFILVSLILYPTASFVLKFIISKQLINEAISLLPFSIVSLILNAIVGVYGSTLDGLQRNYIRSIIFTSSAVILLLITFLLTPIYGIKGVAIAQIVQALFSLLLCLIALIHEIKFNPLKWNWDKKIFSEIFSYGIKLQFISITAMFNEPVTKALLAKFGGLAFTGYYEMASRLVSQVRGVVVGATQSLIPVLIEKESMKYHDWLLFYKKTFKRVYAFSLLFMSGLILFSNIISVIWIGHDEKIFNFTVLFLAISTFVNLIATPAYFSFMAEGKLVYLIVSHLLASFVNVFLGFILGYYFGGNGIILATGAAYFFSTFVVIKYFHKLRKTNILNIFDLKLFYATILIFSAIIIKLFFGGSINYDNCRQKIKSYTTFYSTNSNY